MNNQQENTAKFIDAENKNKLSLAGATGAWTGENYINSLRDGRIIWYNSEQIDVCSHPKFVGALNTLAKLYDTQHTKENRNKMTYESLKTGNRLSYSYLAPRNKRQLEAKWRNSHLWMNQSFGLMPRLPDFMSNVVVGLYDYRFQVGKVDQQFTKNIERYYQYCSEHDISITHAIGDPQIDRSAKISDNPKLALRVVKRRNDGIVVNGAKQLATLAPYCHEALVYLSPSFAKREDKSYIAWFSVPMAAKGLHALCRESHVKDDNAHEHYLSSNYDEQDAMLFFDHVFIPMERVFLLDDAETAFQGFFRINAWALYVGQIRFYYRIKTLLGIASLVSKSIGVNEFRNIQDQLGELTAYTEIVRMSLNSMSSEASLTDSGMMSPASTIAIDSFAAQITHRISEILKIISGSGIIMQPSTKDFQAPQLQKFLKAYMHGKDCNEQDKAKLLKVAWELVADAFGSRQEIYELWNRGDVVRNRIHLYNNSKECLQIEQRLTDWLKNL